MGLPAPVFPLLFVTVLWGGWLHLAAVADHRGLCRRIKFSTWINGSALKFHVIKNLSLFVVPSLRSACQNRCIMDPVCESVNIGPPIKDQFICELSESDHIRHPKDVKRRGGFMYIGPENNPCFSSPCLHNSTCLNGFRDQRYLCECQAGYTGGNCEKDIDECALKTDNCSTHAICSNIEGSFNCSCSPGFIGNGTSCTDINECVSGVHNCHSSASCTNTVGSYSCLCNHPFTGDGKICMHPEQECQTYTILNVADRKDTNITVQSNRRCDSSIISGWYRFDGAAGTRMPTSCVPEYRCGTNAPGWLSNGHPTQAEGQVTRKVCFTWDSNCCHGNINIKVRNCGSYYVYYLSSSPGCTGYCGTD